MCKVSIIIPTYNSAKTICRATESVLKQTFCDFELIIVNDGSTDDTSTILDEIIQKNTSNNIKVITHQENRGRSQARNTGINYASGKYLAFLDADDCWLPTKLEKQINYLEEIYPGEIAAVTTQYTYLGKPEANPNNKISSDTNWIQLLAAGCPLGIGSTLLVSREAFKIIGLLDSEFTRFEDWDWLFRFVLGGYNFNIVSENLALVERSGSPPAELLEGMTNLFIKKHSKDYIKLGIYGLWAKSQLWRYVMRAYATYWRNGKDAFRIFIKMMKTFPFQNPQTFLLLLNPFTGNKLYQKYTSIRYGSHPQQKAHTLDKQHHEEKLHGK